MPSPTLNRRTNSTLIISSQNIAPLPLCKRQLAEDGEHSGLTCTRRWKALIQNVSLNIFQPIPVVSSNERPWEVVERVASFSQQGGSQADILYFWRHQQQLHLQFTVLYNGVCLCSLLMSLTERRETDEFLRLLPLSDRPINKAVILNSTFYYFRSCVAIMQRPGDSVLLLYGQSRYDSCCI